MKFMKNELVDVVLHCNKQINTVYNEKSFGNLMARFVQTGNVVYRKFERTKRIY